MVERKKLIIVSRVVYGFEKPISKIKEYSTYPGGPMGTKAEWKKWAKENKVQIRFSEEQSRRWLY